jgi:lysyl-tRNA synthetase class 2
MTDEQQPQDDINDQMRERRLSLDAIIEQGFNPYPHKFERTHTINQIVALFSSHTAEDLQTERLHVKTAGRIHAINKMGKAAFIRFTDGRELLQIYLRSNEVDEKTWNLFKLLDLGDFIGVEGFLFRTKTGELSVHAETLTFLSKALTPPPDKYYGLHDIEIRYRQRYADLIANRDVREVFEKRSAIIRHIRSYFDTRGYVEVETPMLTPLATGAAARPFITHHNALDIDLYARIAPELYLKRLIAGGFEKVYEINRNFRNEGLSIRHNPEFTMLEWYEAYSDYDDLIRLTENLISELVEKICGQTAIEYGDRKIDFTRPWKRLTMREAVIHFWMDDDKPTIEDLSSREGVWKWLHKSAHPEIEAKDSKLADLDYGHLLGELFERVAEPHLNDPVFITEFPTELSPLSKQSEADPRFVDRFELFIAGMEIANAFCEINDPADQRRRFEDQMKLRERGDDEAMVIDEDYLRALSYGMPPTAGEGIGIDRLVMILTNQKSIRDVILFPHMRPEKSVVSSQSSVASKPAEGTTDH